MATHHPVRDLLLEAASSNEFQGVVREFTNAQNDGAAHAGVNASGLTAVAKTLFAALLQYAVRQPLLYVVRSNRDAEQALDLLETWAKFLGFPAPVFIPAHDIRPYQRLSPHADISEKRALGLAKLVAGQASLVVIPAVAMAELLQPPEFYRGLPRYVRTGDQIDLDELLEHLRSVGYAPHDPVEMTGQFSVRGGILDVFSPETARPARLELLDDTVESIREFDPGTQRSVGAVERAAMLPLTDFPLSKDLLSEVAALAKGFRTDIYIPGEPFPGWEFLIALLRPLKHTILDLCPGGMLFLDEPQELRQEIERFWMLVEPEFDDIRKQGKPAAAPRQLYVRPQDFLRRLASRPVVNAQEFDLRSPETRAASADRTAVHVHFATRQSPRFHGNLQLSLAELKKALEDEYRILVLTTGQGESERLAELFAENQFPFHFGERRSDGAGYQENVAAEFSVPACWIARGAAAAGVMLPSSKLLILGNQDLFDTSAAAGRPAPSRSKVSTFLSDFRDLEPGDLVVHVEHGIGSFRGLKQISHDTATEEFMELEYAEGARLYVPLTRLDLVQKYRTLDADGHPPLDRLGGTSWARTKARVRKSMQDMAAELLKLYAERKVAAGNPYPEDTPWQREFEQSFEFEETPDQLATIDDVRRDMAKAEPMDRLICGDVGYGKTEVAMRAAFRAVTHSKQVAVLAPTTVLAFQHYETFRRRFGAFPIKIELLSRFRTAAQQKATLKDVEAGKVDIVIGTHRLLSKDVVFHDLGLLVVDEEQRFGVRHKERLKAMKKSVDVLALSATPIPRTLHMSLVGLRDMSVIETPPRDRLAIQTVVAPFSEQIVKTAIEQELERGGQVYFIHNRIESLYSIAALVQRLVPHARVATAHGQMGERQLEKVMFQFVRQEANVLVTTTIVENGLDIPMANTILVNRADRHGLAELYQLRGRVGRSNRRAYAYLLVPEETELTPLARRRLSALREFTELGSGFRVAALDMELRGAGNLLGGQQHGHVNAVGFELYCQMLEQAVQDLKGEERQPEVSTTINLGLDVRIPADYIPEEHQRLRMYKTIGRIRSQDERERVEQELVDRYGAPPEQVRNLLEYASLKSAAQRLWIQSIERKNEVLQIHFHPNAPVEPERLMKFISSHPEARFTPSGVLTLTLGRNSHELLSRSQEMLQQLQV
ncbi:MAG: transcription-repair coupling factor [Acidobacteria bacterium]|nr:transcription-repair coupling factor [Acidobacteriota bacterium]